MKDIPAPLRGGWSRSSLAALVVSPAQDIRAKRETEKWNDRGILNTAQMGVSQDPKMMVFYSENDGTSVVGGELEKTGTRWSSWNVGLSTTPQLRIFTLDPSAKSFHKFSSFKQQNEVIMNSYLARIQGLNILCTSKNVGLLNLQLLRSFFHTFCYQKKRPCLPPPRPGPSLRSQSKPGGKRRHPTRPALRRCGGGVSGHCGELHRSMHHQPTFGDSGRCPKCGEKYWDPWKNPWKSRKTDWNGWCLVIFADFVIFEMHVLTDSTGSNIDGLLIGLGDWIGNIDWNRWNRGNQY